MADREQLVRSWNEWDRLEEVVVGRADGAQFEPSEPACRPSVRGSGAIDPFPSGAKSRSSIELANNELDNLASVLVDRGVKVQAYGRRLFYWSANAILRGAESVLRGMSPGRDDHDRPGGP